MDGIIESVSCPSPSVIELRRRLHGTSEIERSNQSAPFSKHIFKNHCFHRMQQQTLEQCTEREIHEFKQF